MIIYQGREMKKIKSFVYLDVNKMYSISSQIFEGLTEYILSEKNEKLEENESQKGPIGSGRVLGDIITKGEKIQEKKYLHDYSYTLFENELINQGKVIEINSVNYSEKKDTLNDFSFIKVKGKLVFKDVKLLADTMLRFNEIGEAIAYVSNFAQIQSLSEEVSDYIKTTKDREAINKAKQIQKGGSNVKKLAKDSGLYQDDTYLKYLAKLLNYGYNDMFEVVISFDDKIFFSAILHRDNIREDEQTIIKKYSRNTEKEFIVFGSVTQSEKIIKTIVEPEIPDTNSNMKQAIMKLVDSFANVEDTFVGRLNNEIVIDPIALYLEL